MRVYGDFNDLKKEVQDKLNNCEIKIYNLTKEDFRQNIFKGESVIIYFHYGNQELIIDN
jgi:hypothetical protein